MQREPALTSLREPNRTATRRSEMRMAMRRAIEAAHLLDVPPWQTGLPSRNHSHHDACKVSRPAATVPTGVSADRRAGANSTDPGRIVVDLDDAIPAAVGDRATCSFVSVPSRDSNNVAAYSGIPAHAVHNRRDRDDSCQQAHQPLFRTTEGESPACCRQSPGRRVSPGSCVSASVRLLSLRGPQHLYLTGYPRQIPRSESGSKSPFLSLWRNPRHTHTVGFKPVHWISS